MNTAPTPQYRRIDSNYNLIPIPRINGKYSSSQYKAVSPLGIKHNYVKKAYPCHLCLLWWSGAFSIVEE